MAPRGFSCRVRSLVHVTGRMVRGSHLSARAGRIALLSALAAMVVGVLLTVPPGSAASASTTWYVSPGGSDSDSCTSPSSPCQHIQTAINRAASGDAIDIAAGTYTETVSISTSLTLAGASAETTIIDGNNQGSVISVASGSVTISGVTIQHGNAGRMSGYDGGGVFNQGDLTVLGSIVTLNSASSYSSGDGGGIYNLYGTVTLISSTVSGNSATGSGGGIDNYNGTLTLTGTTVSSNSAANGYVGGGIADSGGTLTLTNSSVDNNTAGDYGGIFVNGDAQAVTLTNSAICSNTASFDGGGIGYYSSGGQLTLASTAVLSNTSAGDGGGINGGGAIALINSVVAGNGANEGGGIFSGGLALADSSVYSNTARTTGGGIYNAGTLALTNSTVSGNSAGAPFVQGNGGGIYNSGSLALTSSTVSGNSAAKDGGIDNADGTVILTNTILAGNTAPSYPDCSGTLTSGGYSLVGIGDVCGLTNGQDGDQVGTSSSPINPLLGPLQNNGGPTFTMALLTGSPATDYVPSSNCNLATDQRGEPRPDEINDDGYCDIGAYEYQTAPAPSAIITPSLSSGAVGQSVSLTGTNFASHEPISVYWDVTATTPLTSATAGSDGSFTATFTVPQAISGTHTIVVIGQTSGLSATVPFTVTPSASLLHASGVQGSRNVITDDGFGADEQVTTYWGNRRAVVLAISTTNATGTAVLTFTVPMSPTGSYQVVSVGQTSGAVVTATYTLKPHLSISPTSGAPASHAYASGTGFGARERVSVKWNCPGASCAGATTLGTTMTNRDGNFTLLRVTVPSTATVGTYPVGGIGKTSRAFAASYFTVT